MAQNGCTLPPAAEFIVRYHSFYALHREGAYTDLLSDADKAHLPWLLEFNKCEHDRCVRALCVAAVCSTRTVAACESSVMRLFSD